MKAVYFTILIIVGTWGNPAYSVEYDNRQKEVLSIAWEAGAAIGYPETIQAICMQETLAGLLGPVGDTNHKVGKRSYGVMQIKVASARDVFRWYPSKFHSNQKKVTDEEIIVMLIVSDWFNIKVGSLYFKKLIERSKDHPRRWSKSVLAYNQGFHGKSDPNDYIRKVQSYTKQVRLFNRSM